MTSRVSVVIGANYGDEGKGLVTDYLSHQDTLVIRFNGGAQAGHTVVTPEGYRHVFHHFGSGTFTKASTFLSPFFVVNPMYYGRELELLRRMRLEPKVFVDPSCLVSTPYDMLINEAIERKRGDGRHGSCGFGINETVVRSEDPKYRITYNMLSNEKQLVDKLFDICKDYLPKRAAALGITEPIPYAESLEVMTNFLKDVQTMLEHAKPVKWASPFHAGWDRLVFEGAQGLRLDMDSPDFPHVTRSKTGLTNVLALVREAGISDPLDIFYATRTYITRHGAGPLAHELNHLPYPKIADDTNTPNPHQGTLRFGHLDLDQLFWFIQNDLGQVRADIRVCSNLVITCADQLNDAQTLRVYYNGLQHDRRLPELAAECLSGALRPFPLHIPFSRVLVASGRTRDTIREVLPYAGSLPAHELTNAPTLRS